MSLNVRVHGALHALIIDSADSRSPAFNSYNAENAKPE
jgi:hypothetical protein